MISSFTCRGMWPWEKALTTGTDTKAVVYMCGTRGLQRLACSSEVKWKAYPGVLRQPPWRHPSTDSRLVRAAREGTLAEQQAGPSCPEGTLARTADHPRRHHNTLPHIVSIGKRKVHATFKSLEFCCSMQPCLIKSNTFTPEVLRGPRTKLWFLGSFLS